MATTFPCKTSTARSCSIDRSHNCAPGERCRHETSISPQPSSSDTKTVPFSRNPGNGSAAPSVKSITSRRVIPCCSLQCLLPYLSKSKEIPCCDRLLRRTNTCATLERFKRELRSHQFAKSARFGYSVVVISNPWRRFRSNSVLSHTRLFDDKDLIPGKTHMITNTVHHVSTDITTS